MSDPDRLDLRGDGYGIWLGVLCRQACLVANAHCRANSILSGRTLIGRALEQLRAFRALVLTRDVAATLTYSNHLLSSLRGRIGFAREPEALASIRRRLRREARRFQRAGDPAGALGLYDRLPKELRDDVEMLHQRGLLLHRLGRSGAAREVFKSVLSKDPSRVATWHALGVILAELGRGKELEDLVQNVVSKPPLTFDILRKAADLAKRGRLLPLGDKLFDDALALVPSTDARTIVKTAEALLRKGAQGRVINLLRSELVRSHPELRSHALDISNRALAELQLAGRPSDAGPVIDTERADALIVQSLLEQAMKARPATSRIPNGIAIVAVSLGAGGLQKQVVELVRQLCVAHRDIGPIVLLLGQRSSQGPEFHEQRLAGLNVTIEFMSDFDPDPSSVLPAEMIEKFSVLPPRVVKAAVALTSRLTWHNPEVLLVMLTLNSIPSMLAASLARIPRIVVSERSASRRPDKLIKVAYRTVIADNSASLVTNSAATARDFAKWLEVPSERVGVIYNGMDVDELRATRDSAAIARYRQSLGIKDSTRVVGSVFEARKNKRPQLWIQAASVIAKRVPDLTFVIVGDGQDKDELSALIVEHGLQRKFHRPGVRQDAANWLSLMDVVLLTSQFEGTPNVLLEAQALGRPVVATDVGGAAETFLPGETGLLLPAHPTPEEVADAVIRILDDPGFAARASEQGPKFIRERFGAERMAAEFVDLCFGERGRSASIEKIGRSGRI